MKKAYKLGRIEAQLEQAAALLVAANALYSEVDGASVNLAKAIYIAQVDVRAALEVFQKYEVNEHAR